MTLAVREVAAGYGAVRIVEGVSMELGAGETLALLGRNGAGKTTLLRALTGLADRFEGEVTVEGEQIPPRSPQALARRGVTLVPDDRGVFPRLTVAENLELARLGAVGPPPLAVLELFPALRERLGQPAGSLSGGQQQQLAIARALETGARVVIVDELSQGLQPSIVDALAEALCAVTSGASVALLLVEQNPELALRLCDQVAVMEKGRVVASAASADAEELGLLDLLVIPSDSGNQQRNRVHAERFNSD